VARQTQVTKTGKYGRGTAWCRDLMLLLACRRRGGHSPAAATSRGRAGRTRSCTSRGQKKSPLESGDFCGAQCVTSSTCRRTFLPRLEALGAAWSILAGHVSVSIVALRMMPPLAAVPRRTSLAIARLLRLTSGSRSPRAGGQRAIASYLWLTRPCRCRRPCELWGQYG
jgi:hypothetical protein